MRALLLLAVLASPSAAAWRDIPEADFSMAPPPAAGSEQDRKDMDRILALQAARAPGQCELGQRQSSPDFAALFAGSGLLSDAETAAAAPFVNEVSRFASKVSTRFKRAFTRPRPVNEDARVKPCVQVGGNTAYPSFHATAGAVDACVLARLFPGRAGTLEAWGAQVGELRVVVGVHHPTDVAAGRLLGRQICARLLSEPDFAAEADALAASLPRP